MAPSQPSNGELRAAFEHVLSAARTWGRNRTPTVPGRIQELANARRLPGNWMATMRIALEGSADFRSAVAATTDEGSVGRPAWLWLARPDGWLQELSDVRASVDAEDDQVKDDRSVRDRLAGTERRLARAEREIGRLQADNVGLAAEVSRIGQARDAAAARARAADEALLAARAEVSRLARLVVDLEKDVRLHRGRSDRLESELARSEKVASRLRAEAERNQADIATLETDLADVRSSAATDADEADRLLRRATEALQRISGAADDALSSLAAGQADGSGADGRPARPEARGAGLSSRRRPVSLPPAVFDDSVEAVEFLVRVPGIRLVVDGYNVALTSWPGSDIAALRDRLVHALAELSLRLRVGVTIFFDGEGEGGRVPPPRAAARLMTIIFSDSETEADEEILRAVSATDPVVPVVVATDDRAVQAGACRRRANVITVAQLLTALGRGPG